MKSYPAVLWMCLGLAGVAGSVRAQSTPTLRIAPLVSNAVELSWSSNFTGWQLLSASNLTTPAAWQPVPIAPAPLGDVLAVFYTITNSTRFFRLQQGGGGGCVFQATPPTIPPGGSSTLSWCPEIGTAYTLTPGPGLVTGSNYVVSPALTTVYTLTASNRLGTTFETATVTVTTASCNFVNVTNWDCTLSFSYSANPSSSSYIFSIQQFATLTFHFTQAALNGSVAVYTAVLGGNAQLNDSETTVGSPPPLTVVGSGVPLPGQTANLTIDCGTGTYTFDVQPVINADWNGTPMDTRVGSVYVNSRALPLAFGSISSNESLPARGPFWPGTGDWYAPGGLGLYMFESGLVTDTTAGNASVGWDFTPSP